MFIYIYTFLTWCLIILSITHIDRSDAFGAFRLRRNANTTGLKLDDYYTYDEMIEYLDSLKRDYSDRITLQDVGETYENRTLKAITITNGDGRTGKKVIFLVGGEHAREWLAPVVALYTVDQLVVNYEQNAHLLKDYDWIIMPLVNPDGYMYSRTVNRYWRNNRSPNGNDCFGTNINRNYDVAWESGYAEQVDPCGEHYAGRRPFSEPETRAVRDIMWNLVESERAVMFIALHSQRQSIFYPWVSKKSPTEHDKYLIEVARYGTEAMRKATGVKYSYEQPGKYDRFGGTSLDYAYSIGIPLSFTIELAGKHNGVWHDFWPPTRILKDLGQESWVGIKAMSEKTMELYPFNKDGSSPTNISKALLLLALMTASS